MDRTERTCKIWQGPCRLCRLTRARSPLDPQKTPTCHGVSYTILTSAKRSSRRDVSQTTSICPDVSPHDVDMSSRPKDVKHPNDVAGSSAPTRLVLTLPKTRSVLLERQATLLRRQWGCTFPSRICINVIVKIELCELSVLQPQIIMNCRFKNGYKLSWVAYLIIYWITLVMELSNPSIAYVILG